MKNMKHGGKARKTHKRMQDGGMAGYGEAAQPMAYTKGKVGTPAYRPVGRPGFIPSPGIGGNLKPGMRPLASSDAYMRRPGRGGLTPTQDVLANVAGGLSGAGTGYRKGGAVKRKRMADGGMAYTKGKVGTPAHRPVAGSPFSKGKIGTPAHRPVAGGPAGPRAMRGGGLARKGVGMALAKGGLAKRAGGAAKRGVGRGKTV